MGKYMRKAKITGEVAVMEVSHQSPLGVRTRARTLALQRLQKPPPDPPSAAASYLQLRSRRLEKPAATPPHTAKPCKESQTPTANPNPSSPKSNPGSRMGAAPVNSSSVGSVSMRSCSMKDAVATVAASEADTDGGIEVSFGENVLEIENRDRNARETTPCSLIRDSETIRTPGSSTRPTNSTANNQRAQNPILRNIPTAREMEEFFAVAEQLQQRIFKEKYNFDPVNEHPLPGRYEWVKLDS